jgi:acyl-coenzyme A synthetase/AMP-(fatty) acid ligase
LVRYLPDHKIEFLSRIDRQVKIRGYRVELREIESVLNLHAAVRESVVVLEQEEAGEKKLVAYVVLASSSSAVIGELRDSLKQKLPTYMLPSAIVALDAFP